MKICFVHNHKFRFDGKDFYSSGGLSNEVLSKYLVNPNDEIFVFSRVLKVDNVGNNFSKITNPNIHIVAYNRKTILKEILNYDKCIIRMPSPISFYVFLLSKFKKENILVEVVGSAYDAFANHGKLGKVCAPFMEILMKKCVKKAKFVTYVSENYLQRKYKNLKNNISCSDVQIPEVQGNILDKRIQYIQNNNQDFFNIFTIGAIDIKYKNQIVILKVLKRNKYIFGKEIKYHLVGSGDRSKLETYAIKNNLINNVIFHGAVNHDMIFNLIENMDLYIHPSTVEGTPRSVIEVMSRACPVVASNIGGIPELVEDEFLFNPRNISSISQKIRELSVDKLIKSATAGFERSLNFNRKDLSIKWLNFYRHFYNS